MTRRRNATRHASRSRRPSSDAAGPAVSAGTGMKPGADGKIESITVGKKALRAAPSSALCRPQNGTAGRRWMYLGRFRGIFHVGSEHVPLAPLPRPRVTSRRTRRRPAWHPRRRPSAGGPGRRRAGGLRHSHARRFGQAPHRRGRRACRAGRPAPLRHRRP